MLATTAGAPVAAFANEAKRLYGVQWHPEVKHSAHGQQVLENFLYNGAGLSRTGPPRNILDEQVEKIREQVGDGRAICGLSGGVDSAVAAALVQRAIGDQLTCVFVNHGLLREGEAEQVETRLRRRHRRQALRRRRAGALPERPGRRDGSGNQAQDHRPRIHPRVRGSRDARSSPRQPTPASR